MPFKDPDRKRVYEREWKRNHPPSHLEKVRAYDRARSKRLWAEDPKGMAKAKRERRKRRVRRIIYGNAENAGRSD